MYAGHDWAPLRAMTIWPAFQIGEEDAKGSIEVGKLADLVVLDRDPFEISPQDIGQAKVCATFIRGELAYQNEQLGVIWG